MRCEGDNEYLSRQGFGRRQSWHVWRYYPHIHLSKLRRTMDHLNQY